MPSTSTLRDIIASARADVPAVLTFANRDIVVLRAAILGRASTDRVAAARTLLTGVAAEGRRVRAAMQAIEGALMVRVDGREIFAILPADVDVLAGETLEAKGEAAVARLQQALDENLEANTPRILFWGAVQALAASGVFLLLLWFLARIHRSAGARVARTTERHLATSRVADELVRKSRLLLYVQRMVTLAIVLAGLATGYIWLTFVLRRFPYTRPWGESLRSFLVERLAWLGQGILHAIPELFTIILIVTATRVVLRLTQLLFAGVEEGRLTLPWVYPETAAPTRKLVTVLVWLFALIVAYPYLPGSETEAFKGVSVFAGLMISLGASGIVNQVISGLMVTYSRALRTGDFVRVGDVEGTVTHLGTLSTKVETARGEEITIPNALVVSHEVTNYSRNADMSGVYVPTSVTIGYDTPWRQVHSMLLVAATRTPGVQEEPAPKVVQTALQDFYVQYTLLVCLDEPRKRAATLSVLHANIQDAFNEHGVQIMSPNYEADPHAPKVVPKERWYMAPAGEKPPSVPR